MATSWSDVQGHMRATYKLVDDEPDMMSLVWDYEGKRYQKVVLRRYRWSDRDMLEVKSAFAHKGNLDPAAMLEASGRLPLGTVALSGDVYLVVYNAILGTLGLDDVDFLLKKIAGAADNLEEKFLGRDHV